MPTPTLCGQCMAAIHQGAGQRACHATYEEARGTPPPPIAYYRCSGKKNKQNAAASQPQEDVEGEVQGLISCQRQKSQQRARSMLMSFVRHVCIFTISLQLLYSSISVLWVIRDISNV